MHTQSTSTGTAATTAAAPAKYRKVREVAAMFDVHRATIYRAIESGALPAVRLGTGRGGLRVSDEAVDEWLSQRATAGQGVA